MSARKRTFKRKRKSRLRRKLERWAWRKVSTWAAEKRAKIRKLVKPQVIISSVGQRAWESQFPNPRRPVLNMKPVQEHVAEFEAVFGNGWRVEFGVDLSQHHATLREEAYDFAVLKHGEIMRSIELVDVLAVNDLAVDVLAKLVPW